MQSKKIIYRYSEAFKLKIISELETGKGTVSQIKKKYDIRGGGTIQAWLKKYGKDQLRGKIVRIEMKGEKDRLKELEKQVQHLKTVLADKELENILLESLIDTANEYYQTDLKKNFGEGQLKKPRRKSSGK